MKVIAIRTGYYDYLVREEGDVFDISEDKAFSSKWMEKVPSDAAPVLEKPAETKRKATISRDVI